MSIGESGRIVIEIVPDMKRELHAMLSRDGQTLKSWFVAHVEQYIQNGRQLSTFDGNQKITSTQTNRNKGNSNE